MSTSINENKPLALRQTYNPDRISKVLMSASTHDRCRVKHACGLRFHLILVVILAFLPIENLTVAQDDSSADSERAVPRNVLTEDKWQQIDQVVDRGLQYLASTQRADGSWHPSLNNEPGISGLCLMAFLSRGHLPGQGIYGDTTSKATEYLFRSQQPDGLIARSRQPYHAAYSHGIAALVISELYGMSRPSDDARHRETIEKALKFTGHRYSQPKASSDDNGGWRYLRRHAVSDSDLSVTSWNVMFLRSARNSGFEIDRRLVDEALEYMERVYDPKKSTFRYEIHSDEPAYIYSRGMAGAGVLSLSLAGRHNSEMAQSSARYILSKPFDQYVRPGPGEQYPCYGAFYCSYAMFQMGGVYWKNFYPQMSATLCDAQQRDGSWTLREGEEVRYGTAYMTALSLLALTPPYQTMPIFQR